MPKRPQPPLVKVDAAVEKRAFRALQDRARINELLAFHGWNYAQDGIVIRLSLIHI